jgi:hypothetical protein
MLSGLIFVAIAEVVGSINPTRSTFIIMVNYGIELSSLLESGGQIQQQCHCHANNSISINTLNGGFQQLQRTIR